MKQPHHYQALQRFAACAGLLCALALSAGGPALGQENPPSAGPPKASPAAPALPDQAEKRITDLRARLGITPAQEKAWEDLARVMRENADKMKALLDKWSQEQGAEVCLSAAPAPGGPAPGAARVQHHHPLSLAAMREGPANGPSRIVSFRELRLSRTSRSLSLA